MADIQFETNPNEFGRPPEVSSGADITGKLVEWGLASNRTQAEYILITIAVISLLIAVYLFFFSGGGGNVPSTPNYGTQLQ
jgi:hypothetical protein